MSELKNESGVTDPQNIKFKEEFDYVIHHMDENAKKREETRDEALKKDLQEKHEKMNDEIKKINTLAAANAEYIKERKALEDDAEMLNKSYNAPIKNEDMAKERAYRDAVIRFNMGKTSGQDDRLLEEGPFNAENIQKRQLDDEMKVHFGFLPSLNCTEAERAEGDYRLAQMDDLHYHALTSTADNGGRLLHPRLSNMISDKVLANNPILDEVKVVMDSANRQYEEIIEDTEMGSQRAIEGTQTAAATTADPMFDRISITKHATQIVNGVTLETLMWSVPDIEAWLNKASVRKFSQQLGNQHMVYNANGIHGIVGNPRLVNPNAAPTPAAQRGLAANNAAVRRTTKTGNTFNFADIVAAKFGLIQEIRRMPNVKCFVSDGTLQALESFSDSNIADGALLFRRGFDGIGGAAATVLGKRIVECPSMGDPGSLNQTLLFFADLKEGYCRVRQPGIYQFKEDITDQRTSGVRFVRKLWEGGEVSNTQYVSQLITPLS